MIYFDSDTCMSKSTNMIVYFDWKTVIMSPLRTKGDILFQSDFFFFRFCFFCFFSAKLVQTITFLSFQIGQLYLVCGCMTFMGPLPLTSRSYNCFLNSIYLVCGCMTIRRCVAYHNDLRGILTFDLKVK